MLEKELERYLVKEIKKRGGRAYKFISPGNDGVPDRIVIMPGCVPVFVELKTESGRLTELQRVQINRLEELEQDVWILHGKIAVDNFLWSMVNDQRRIVG